MLGVVGAGKAYCGENQLVWPPGSPLHCFGKLGKGRLNPNHIRLTKSLAFLLNPKFAPDLAAE